MYADFDFLEDRIIQRSNFKAFAFGINKDIRRSVIRLGGTNQIVSLRNADHDVTTRLLERGVHGVPDESSSLSPPHVTGGLTEFLRDQARDLVLETFQPPI